MWPLTLSKSRRCPCYHLFPQLPNSYRETRKRRTSRTLRFSTTQNRSRSDGTVRACIPLDSGAKKKSVTRATSRPGQPGNVVLAGHRDTFFRPLRKIEMCDEVSLDTAARTYHYRVSSFEVVDPHHVNELTYHGKDELTLITCYPFSYIGSAPKRFVVHAEPIFVLEKCGSS